MAWLGAVCADSSSKERAKVKHPMQRKQAMDLDQQLPHLWQRFQHWWVTPAGQPFPTNAAEPDMLAAAGPLFLQGCVLATPRAISGVALIRAIDAGGVPLNPMRVNDIGRKLGLVVLGSAPMDETIERIRQQLLAMTQHAPEAQPDVADADQCW
jgi:hypothetical protein